MINQFGNKHLYLMLLADAGLFAASILLAYLLRFDFAPAARYWNQALFLLLLAIPVKAGCFIFFGLYRGMWRYTDLYDFWRIFQAAFISSLILVSIVLFVYRFQGYPRSIFFIDGILTFVLTGGLRIFIRTVYRSRENLRSGMLIPGLTKQKREGGLTRVLIAGAGDAGEKILREILENPELRYDVIGFLDDNTGKKNRSVHGVPVLGSTHDLPELAKGSRVDQVFLVMPSASGGDMRRIVETCKKAGVNFKTLPGLGEIMDGKVSVSDLREVHFEDLLGRPPVELDSQSIGQYLKGRTVLVTGAGGSIGSELCRQILAYEPGRLILLDASELNLYTMDIEFSGLMSRERYTPLLGRIQDRELMDRYFGSYRPQVVFHAAAFKHVPILEDNPWEAVYNNVHGSRIVMETARKHGVDTFVIVSTDKAVRPTSVMGATKRMTELLMHCFNQEDGTRFMAVRFGNVVGSSGSVIPLFKKQIAAGGPVTVTHPEVTRYFMTIQEASQLILQAGAIGTGGEIFVLEMGTPVRIADMARDLIRLMGKEPDHDVEIVYTGLRPGEKIFEELITDEEGVVPTRHAKIMVLQRNSREFLQHEALDRRGFLRQVDDLVRAATSQDGEHIRRKLREVVPEYRLPV
ncbi:MAG: polysaccharide biosynthesis protein [Desulfovermiculus sp.]